MNIHINRESNVPVFQQIKNQIYEMICSGELPNGYVLPSERTLASMLGVNRTTVASAYSELKADNLIEAKVGKGTVVLYSAGKNAAEALKKAPPWNFMINNKRYSGLDFFINDIIELSGKADVISFAANFPDPQLLPLEKLSEIQQQLLQISPAQLVNPGSVQGYKPLRKNIRNLMLKNNINVSSHDILLFSGALHALDYCCRTLTTPGDLVLVEEPTYHGVLQLFQSSGLNVKGVPIDEYGIRTDVLRVILSSYKPKFLYTIPMYHNPTGTVMSLNRRYELIKLAEQYQFPIIEDDAYGALNYDGENPPALKTLDTQGYVLYVGTFSKVLAAGLSIGWMAVPKDIKKDFIFFKQLTGLHNNSYGQWMINEFINQGYYDLHLAQIRNAYKEKRDFMHELLKTADIPGLTWHKPTGGYCLWIQLPKGINATKLMAKSFDRHVFYTPGEIFYSHGGSAEPSIRLNFTFPSLTQIEEGINKLTSIIKTII